MNLWHYTGGHGHLCGLASSDKSMSTSGRRVCFGRIPSASLTITTGMCITRQKNRMDTNAHTMRIVLQMAWAFVQ